MSQDNVGNFVQLEKSCPKYGTRAGDFALIVDVHSDSVTANAMVTLLLFDVARKDSVVELSE